MFARSMKNVPVSVFRRVPSQKALAAHTWIAGLTGLCTRCVFLVSEHDRLLVAIMHCACYKKYGFKIEDEVWS